MRQHRLANDVADGEDVQDVGAHLLFDRDEAALVDAHAGVLGVDPLAVRLRSFVLKHRLKGVQPLPGLNWINIAVSGEIEHPEVSSVPLFAFLSAHCDAAVEALPAAAHK